MSEFLPAILTGGLGAALGGIGTALIQSISNRGGARAEAADRVTNAAGNLADRLDKMNLQLESRLAKSESQNRQLREALMSLTEAVEDLIPIAPPDTRIKVQKAINMAKLSTREM